MADSVQRDTHGPDWPLGLILNATPGTPINIMSLVDASNVSAPQTVFDQETISTTTGKYEYTSRANAILFTAQKKGASHGTQNNTGNIYILRAAAGGAGGRDDYGCYVTVIRPTDPPFRLYLNTIDRDTLGPYRYFIDADNAADGCFVTLLIG